MRLSIYLYLSLLCFNAILLAQSKPTKFLTSSKTLNIKRRNTVVISEAALSSLTLIGLNEIWYADFERSKFQTVNDNDQWLQLDKFGHVFSSYQLGRQGANLLQWSGVNKKNQLLYGATLGFGFLTAVEVLDGFSSEWGFSWGDVAANALGTGFYISQELLWNEQRIHLKFGFIPSIYANLNPEQLGNSLYEQILKDYNGQTYWLSFNIHSFFKVDKIPKWLNIAVGYGGEGLLSGINTTDNQMLTTITPYRQYYLSLDIDLCKLKTNSAVLRSVFNILNMIKIPFPALEFSKNGTTFRLLHY